MRLHRKLAGGFAFVALLSLAVALVAFRQVRTLSEALYEVGAVRMPSLEGLHLMNDARRVLDASAQVLPHADTSRWEQERELQARMWNQADRGRILYEPLPQTAEEAALWQLFLPAWQAWRAQFDAVVTGAASVRDADSSFSEVLQELNTRSEEMGTLLTALIELNRELVEDAKRRSITTRADVDRAQRLILWAAVGGCFSAVTAGWVFGLMIARPAERAARVLGRVAQGDLQTTVPVEGDDELGQVAHAVNHMIEALRDRESRLRSLADNLPNGVVYHLVSEPDGSHRFAYVSGAVQRLNGLSAEAVMGDADLLFNQILEEDRPLIAEAERRGRADFSSYQVEVRLRRPDGEVRWMQFASAPRLLPDGRMAWDGIELDITDARRTEEALRRSERELRMIFDHAPMGISLIKDRRFVRVNAFQYHLLGYTEAELTGASVRQVYPSEEDYAAAGRDLYDELQRGGIVLRETIYRHKSGDPVRLQLCLVPVEPSNLAAGVVCLTLDLTLQRRVEETLQRREREMQVLLESAPVGICLVRQRTFVRVNRAMCDMFGYREDELIGSPTDLLFAQPEDLTRLREEYAKNPPAAGYRAYEVRGRRRDGTEADILLHTAFLETEPSWRGVASCVDITDQKRASAALRLSEARLQEVFDHASEIIFVVNVRVDGQFTFEQINRAVERYGWNVQDFSGGRHSPADLFDPATARELESYYRRCLEERQPVEMQQTLGSPRGRIHFTTTLFPVFDPQERRVVRVVGFATDTTDRHQAEEALRRSEEKYRGIFQNAVEGLFQAATEGALLSANPALAQLFGYHSPGELIEQATDFFRHRQVRPERAEELVERLRREGAVTGFECEIARADDRKSWLSFTVRLIVRENEAPSYEGLVVDTTAQRRATALEAANVRAEAANRAKSVFLANMSHEIRTPMNAILGFAQLMMRDPQVTPTQRRHLATIGSNGEHLLSLINDILEMSKIEANRATLTVGAFELSTLARDLDSMFRARIERKGLLFTVQVGEPSPVSLLGDLGKLRQIFVNLLSNALKFTSRGEIHLRLEVQPCSDGRMSLRGEVADTGPGIGQDDLPRLFDHFEQTEVGRRVGEGTGLGLPISRSFARMMEGDITVETRLGHGSTFRLQVVLATGPARVMIHQRPLAAPRPLRLAPGSPVCRILVVDDEADSRRLMLELLASTGFEVRDAANGEAGVQWQQAWRPQAVLMDLRMPGMGGMQAIRTIRQRTPVGECRIIGLTASAFAEDRDRVIQAGADSFMLKPVRFDELLLELGRLLDLRYLSSDPPVPTGLEPGREAALVELPAALIHTLRSAAIAADFEEVLAAVAQVREHSSALADQLADYAHQFDYPSLRQTLDLKVRSTTS